MIEFESIHCLFVTFILAIIYFVWKSTEVRRETQAFDSIQAFGVRRSSSLLSNASTASSASTLEDNLTSSVEELAQNIFTEASENFNALNDQGVAATANDENEEQERIINTMDRDMQADSIGHELRRRRRSDREVHARASSIEFITSPLSSPPPPPPPTTTTAPTAPESESNIQMIKDEDKISIKLKYLNDEIKTVECSLRESLGNFKKRNFKTELESKLIKLIFNGKLLEDDKKSMQQCGIFSEAVVHCLILQKKNQVNAVNQNANVNANRRGGAGTGGNNFINNINFEWNVIGMILVCVTLVICWYCRLQYAYFSWYSTIGLILLTSLFIVLIPLFTRVFS